MNQVPSKAETMAALMPKGGRPASTEAANVEHSRAVAQVQAACVLAQQRPRDEIAATHRMRAACQNIELASRAFFKYDRGGSKINGASIHLAREIARCWGNIDYGVVELSRNDFAGESEMLAYAWDLETNNRNVNTFVVPHKRDTKQGAKQLTDLRDIYENNANNAARRLRECIFAVLPKSYVEEAKRLCMETIQNGGGTPLETRRERMLEAFTALGITRKQIEKKMGCPADKLTAHDLAMLTVTFQSLKHGETTIEEEFESDNATDMAEQLKRGTTEESGKNVETNDAGEVVKTEGAKPVVDPKAKASEARKADQTKPNPAAKAAGRSEEADGGAGNPEAAAASSSVHETTDEKPAEARKLPAWQTKLLEGLAAAKDMRGVEAALIRCDGQMADLKKTNHDAWEDLMVKVDEAKARFKTEDDL